LQRLAVFFFPAFFHRPSCGITIIIVTRRDVSSADRRPAFQVPLLRERARERERERERETNNTPSGPSGRIGAIAIEVAQAASAAGFPRFALVNGIDLFLVHSARAAV